MGWRLAKTGLTISQAKELRKRAQPLAEWMLELKAA